MLLFELAVNFFIIGLLVNASHYHEEKPKQSPWGKWRNRLFPGKSVKGVYTVVKPGEQFEEAPQNLPPITREPLGHQQVASVGPEGAVMLPFAMKVSAGKELPSSDPKPRKFDRKRVVNSITTAYTWIISSFPNHYKPLVNALERMVNEDYYKDLTCGQLQIALINVITDTVLKPQNPTRQAGLEDILLSSFLLAPIIVRADRNDRQKLREYLAGFSNFDWRPYLMFIKNCLICEKSKETLFKDLHTVGINVAAYAPTFEVFFAEPQASQWTSEITNSLIQMFGLARDDIKMLKFYENWFRDDVTKFKYWDLHNNVHKFLDRVIVRDEVTFA
jgi:hypothetical protein